MSETALALLKQLIQRPSVTPEDGGCQQLIAARLETAGFRCEDMPFNNVKNLWARRGSGAPLVVFAGHTDVVPPGPLDAWQSDPFRPEIRDGKLYGRGATDMKSGLAAMIVAAENFVREHPDHAGSIGFLITSDEEGPAHDGTKKVIETLNARNEKIDYCIVGEASSKQMPGDRIRVGRRGSLHGKLRIVGKQGHIAYPENTRNPIHFAGPVIQTLSETVWDNGNEHFPPTTFQISNIHAGTGALNVVPGALEMDFNFRFATSVTVPELQKRVTDILEKNGVEFALTWECSALPFVTERGKLVQAATDAISEVMNIKPELSTGGGTSDGRFIAPTGAEVIELGPVATSAHEVNEHLIVEHLDPLVRIYQTLLKKLLP